MQGKLPKMIIKHFKKLIFQDFFIHRQLDRIVTFQVDPNQSFIHFTFLRLSIQISKINSYCVANDSFK